MESFRKTWKAGTIVSKKTISTANLLLNVYFVDLAETAEKAGQHRESMRSLLRLQAVAPRFAFQVRTVLPNHTNCIIGGKEAYKQARYSVAQPPM